MICVWRILAAAMTVFAAQAVTVDPEFDQGPGTDTFVEQALPLPDGKILICGAFTKYNDDVAVFLARLNEDGTLDSTFQHLVNGWVRHMVVQPDGKIVVAGAFSQVEGQPRSLIARLNANGSLDRTFAPGLGFQDKVVPADTNAPYVFWMDLQPDGKIVAAGSFAKYNGRTVNGIARINPDGTLDETFKSGGGLNSWSRFARVLPNGQILLSGWFTSYDGTACNRLIRLNADGTIDPSFLPYFGDKTAIYCAVPLADGRMIVSGHSKSDFNLFKRGIARLNADGSEDKTFTGITDERTECVVLQPDGKILASGWFTTANGEPRRCLARFNPDGSLDESFVADGEFFIWNLAFDAKGRLLLAGGFRSIAGKTRTGIARLTNLKDETPAIPPPAKPLVMGNCGFIQSGFKTVIPTEKSKNYCLEYCDRLQGGAWNSLPPVPGNGGLLTLQDPIPAWQRFYRVRVME